MTASTPVGPEVPRGEPGPPAVLTFPGRPTVLYLATCLNCGDPHSRPIPRLFDNETDRDRWADGHADTTGHHIDLAVEIRPEPTPSDTERTQP